MQRDRVAKTSFECDTWSVTLLGELLCQLARRVFAAARRARRRRCLRPGHDGAHDPGLVVGDPRPPATNRKRGAECFRSRFRRRVSGRAPSRSAHLGWVARGSVPLCRGRSRQTAPPTSRKRPRDVQEQEPARRLVMQPRTIIDCDGCQRTPSAPADRDDRGGQLHRSTSRRCSTWSRTRSRTRSTPTPASSTSTTSERTSSSCARRTGRSVEDMTRRPRMRPGRGDHRLAPRERAPIMIAAKAHLDPRFKRVPEPARGRVRVDPRRSDPRAGEARRRAERAHARAPLVQPRRDRAARSRSPPRSRSRSCMRSCTREAQRRVARARGARAHLGGRLRVALPRGVARGDRQDDDGRGQRDRRRARARGRQIAWPEGRAGAHNVRLPLRWKRRQIGELVCDRDTPFTDDDARCSRRSPTTRPSPSSTGAR